MLQGELRKRYPSNTVFQEEANFFKSTFHESVILGCVTFLENAVFVGAAFKENLSFDNCTLYGTENFREGNFTKNLSFRETKFIQETIFNWANFTGDTYFGNCVFEQSVSFQGAKISGSLTFRGSKFKDRLNLADIDLRPGGRILLTLDQIGKYQWPVWLDRWLVKINCVCRLWPCVCLIDGEDSNDKTDLQGAAAQYNMLRDNFRALPSKDDEEDRCHYKYKDLTRRATKGHHLWRFWDWAIMKWCLGYGIYTKRILATAIGVMFAFAIFYHFAAGPELIKHFDFQFNPLYFSVITFTTIGYGDYAPVGWLRFFAGVEGLLGLVLIAVFTVSFARKLIR